MKALVVMMFIGLLLGFGLSMASKIFYIKEDERFEKLMAMLPGYNCGACGYPGCSGMANAIVHKETDTLTCRPCKLEQRKAIVEYINSTTDEDGNPMKIKSI